MKRQLYRITLYSVLTYLALSAPNPAVVATQPSGENGTHFCGVTEGQLDNRRYARSFRNKRSLRYSTNGAKFLTDTL